MGSGDLYAESVGIGGIAGVKIGDPCRKPPAGNILETTAAGAQTTPPGKDVAVGVRRR